MITSPMAYESASIIKLLRRKKIQMISVTARTTRNYIIRNMAHHQQIKKQYEICKLESEK